MIEQVLGNRYKLVRELGAGGMAWVYQAEDQLEHTQVAVKILYPQFSRDISYVQRFIREAKLALQISSEHIVRILNYGADRDIRYLVMEQIEGEDLGAILNKRVKLPWQEALEIGAQVAIALDAANAHSIVHRDIKPQNIMITNKGLVKVLDFGIARARTLPSLTQTGFVGSPSYISPEQAMGKQVDIRSDIYSLGIVLYEAICGHLPFVATTPWSIISQHIAQKPPRLELDDQALPPAAQALIDKMLAKDPDDRYQVPGELLADIESTLRGAVKPSMRAEQPAKPPTQDAGPSKAHQLLLSSLYERAKEAAQAKEWPQAVNLFNQIVKVDPCYQDTPERLAYAGLQARLAALYHAAQVALQAKRWQEAIDELSEIIDIDEYYLDAAQLLAQARAFQAETQARERAAELYNEGLSHYKHQEWQQAADCFSRVIDLAPDHQQAEALRSEAHRRLRWSKSLTGRVKLTIMGWFEHINEPQENKPSQSS